MTCRIQQYAPSVRPRLKIGPPRPQPHGFGLGGIEIVDCQVQVHLLGDGAIRPGRRAVTAHPGHRERTTFCLHDHNVVGGMNDLAVKKLGPEGRQRGRIVAVKDRQCQPGERHAPRLTTLEGVINRYSCREAGGGSDSLSTASPEGAGLLLTTGQENET